MTDWLVKRFVKDYEETGNNVVRTRYGDAGECRRHLL